MWVANIPKSVKIFDGHDTGELLDQLVECLTKKDEARIFFLSLIYFSALFHFLFFFFLVFGTMKTMSPWIALDPECIFILGKMQHADVLSSKQWFDCTTSIFILPNRYSTKYLNAALPLWFYNSDLLLGMIHLKFTLHQLNLLYSI